MSALRVFAGIAHDDAVKLLVARSGYSGTPSLKQFLRCLPAKEGYAGQSWRNGVPLGF